MNISFRLRDIPNRTQKIIKKDIQYRSHACNRVFIVSIGYKAASTKTPAAPPAMTPSAMLITKPKKLTSLLVNIHTNTCSQ